MGRVVLVAAALAALLPSVARAEMPQNRALPSVEGRAAVGEVLLGHNGTWMYADGSGCGAECFFSFAWQRCAAGECRVVGANRGYRVRLADLGRELRVVVTATKLDCGAWNNAAGTQECALVSRSAEGAAVRVTARARVAARAVAWPARLLLERRSLARGVLRATVADTLGRLVVGARVTVAGKGGVTRARSRADGSVAVRVPRGARVAVVRAGSRSLRARLR